MSDFRRFWGRRAALGLLFVAAGCATILSGREQTITVRVLNAKGADCKGVDKMGRAYNWENTPSSATVVRGDGPLTLTCRAKGFKKLVYLVPEQLNIALAGNVATLGLGAAIDALSGAAETYPEVIQLPMEPAPGAPAEKVAEYQRLKRRLEELKREKEEETGIEIEEASGGKVEEEEEVRED